VPLVRNIICSLQVQNLCRKRRDVTEDELKVEREEKMAKLGKFSGGCTEVVEYDVQRPDMHSKEEKIP